MIEEKKVVVEQDLMKRVIVQVLKNQHNFYLLLQRQEAIKPIPDEAYYSDAMITTNELLAEFEDE